MQHGLDLTKVDFAKNKTSAHLNYERMRQELFIEIQQSIEPKGFFNRLFHKIAKIPLFYWS